MEEVEVFQGENLPLALTITSEPSSAVVSMALVRGHMTIVKSWSTADSTLVKDDGSYKCELTSEETQELIPGNYALEGKVVSDTGTIIRPLATIVVKRDKVYEV